MKKLITSLALALTALSSYAITPLWKHAHAYRNVQFGKE